jgi:hypothetical protein
LRKGAALQQSARKFISRRVACIPFDVNGARIFAAEETSLCENNRRTMIGSNVVVHTSPKLQWLNRYQVHQLIKGHTYYFPTTEETAIACRIAVFVWQLGVRLHLYV